MQRLRLIVEHVEICNIQQSHLINPGGERHHLVLVPQIRLLDAFVLNHFAERAFGDRLAE
jgi:hypothetical protein